ncbi:MAG: hypothetical protein IIC35_08145 [Gemmatimonadetes bacterium]|nr:hypothetical protein [Gemmatimonadota bacterium]
MSGFDRREGELFCEGVSLCAIARKAGTPTYVYSGTAIRDNYRSYDTALASLSHEIHYAVKANSSLGVLALLAREGAGFDIVSGGELFRVLQAGGSPEKVVFSGVGKSAAEIALALLHVGVLAAEATRVRTPARDTLPVRGTSSGSTPSRSATPSGVSPLGTIHASVPSVRFSAVIRPQGGFTIGIPRATCGRANPKM